MEERSRICKESCPLDEQDRRAEFDRVALPHLEAAYNLARWLMRHDQDAEDAVQEAYMRAFQFFHSFHGDTGRAWILQIVRNTCYTRMAARHVSETSHESPEVLDVAAASDANPATLLERQEDRKMLLAAVDGLPIEFREVIVLRELEELSYKDIARIAEVPIGTVMSRLARARERLHEILDGRGKG
jgi:RNA polymerase sigma-70 factor (ECF subfamily)